MKTLPLIDVTTIPELELDTIPEHNSLEELEVFESLGIIDLLNWSAE